MDTALRCQPRVELRVVLAADAAAENAAAAAAAIVAMAPGREALVAGAGGIAVLKRSTDSSSTPYALPGDVPSLRDEEGVDGEDGRGGPTGEGDGRAVTATPTELERGAQLPTTLEELAVAGVLLEW